MTTDTGCCGMAAPETADPTALREQVRDHYGAAARNAADGSAGCCGGETTDLDFFGPETYGNADREQLPEEALLASLGCGNPVAVADLVEGETVLDLGSGGGIDVLLSARRVGASGRAYGLDMTDDMLELARGNAAKAGATNVEFVRGDIENIPLPEASVDVIISNCVINLSTDKPAVFAEMARVVRSGGRVGVSDVVAEDRLSADERARRGGHIGCIAGALSFAEYRRQLTAAGFADVSIRPTHEVADGMHSAIVRARKPSKAEH